MALKHSRGKLSLDCTLLSSCTNGVQMASFRGLTADRRPFDEFKTRARGMPVTAIALDLFEWAEAATHGEERVGIRSIEELEAQSTGAVRVM